MLKTFSIAVLIATALPMFSQEWQLDLDQATQQAKDENKSVVLVFQGSDWCGPCKMLDKNVWETEEFKTYAADHFVLVKADFPRKRKNKLSDEQTEKNNQLAASYNEQGYFPLVVVLDADKNVLGKTGYKKMTANEYIQHINELIN